MLNINFGLELCISPPHPSCSSLDVFMFSSPSIQPLIPSGLVLGVPKTIAKAEPCRRQRPSTHCCSQLLPGGGGEEGAGPPFVSPPEIVHFFQALPRGSKAAASRAARGFSDLSLVPVPSSQTSGGRWEGDLLFCFVLF